MGARSAVLIPAAAPIAYAGAVEEKRMAMTADWQPAIFATSVEAPRLSEVPIFIETLILDFL